MLVLLNTLRPRQNGRRFADDTFKRIFLNENVRISIKISLKFVPKGPINNIPALVQIMAWRRIGDKPLSEPMIINLLTHICVTRPQWVNPQVYRRLHQTLIMTRDCLTHWGQVMHIWVGNLSIFGSDNGFSLGWCQAIIGTNATILLNWSPVKC